MQSLAPIRTNDMKLPLLRRGRGSARFWRGLPPLSAPLRVRLLIASLALNVILGLGVWWFQVGQPAEDEAALMNTATRLAELDREASVAGFAQGQPRAMAEQRGLLLSALAPVLDRLGDDARPELLNVVASSYEMQGDFRNAIKLERQVTLAQGTPLTMRINAYKALGRLYAGEIGGSPQESNRSFAAALDLVAHNTDPQSLAAAAAINLDWAIVMTQLGDDHKAFERLIKSRGSAIALSCGFAGRGRLMNVLRTNLATIAGRNDTLADQLNTAIAYQPDPCAGATGY